MKPFLLLASRPEDVAADAEYEAFLRIGGLAERDLRRVRVEAGPMPVVDLDDYSGVIVGGGPFNSSDPKDTKSDNQLRVEAELAAVLDQVVPRDFPFLGACYGIGTLGTHQGGVIDRTYGEPVGAVEIVITADGLLDPLLKGVPEHFEAFVGHKEACRVLPPSGVLLARSAACPVQMFRVGRNVYATQFHPELDVAGIVTRVHVYRDAGYFSPESVDELIAQLGTAVVSEPPRILQNFLARYS